MYTLHEALLKALLLQHHEIVHKWALEKVLKNWGVVAGEGEHTEVQYEIRCEISFHLCMWSVLGFVSTAHGAGTGARGLCTLLLSNTMTSTQI